MHPLHFLLTPAGPYRPGRLAGKCDSFKKHQKNRIKFKMIKMKP
ncbi:protein of unknown function [Serratia sp. Tan611]|nr:protein of unknown function [Serratia sp. Tan611]